MGVAFLCLHPTAKLHVNVCATGYRWLELVSPANMCPCCCNTQVVRVSSGAPAACKLAVFAHTVTVACYDFACDVGLLTY
eukprot:5945747-Amphidinium_carterae.1